MRELPLRLEPGADLRRSLEALAQAGLPDGAFVVCGIGSLEDPRLRLADAARETVYPGPCELLTLSGTITRDGAHLHMSIALADGAVRGGHVVAGNRVRTTVEVLLVELSGWSLGRVPDAHTGFLELRAAPRGG